MILKLCHNADVKARPRVRPKERIPHMILKLCHNADVKARPRVRPKERIRLCSKEKKHEVRLPRLRFR